VEKRRRREGEGGRKSKEYVKKSKGREMSAFPCADLATLTFV